MNEIISLLIASLVAGGIVLIGCLYLVAPQRIVGGFGLKPPLLDADHRAWLRLKGIRDVASGVLVVTFMLASDYRALGMLLGVLAIIPLGDMANVLASGGRKSTAYAVHGVTGLLMIVASGLLLRAGM